MRILILSGLFFACMYYFRSTEETLTYDPALPVQKKKILPKVELPRDEVTTVLSSKISEGTQEAQVEETPPASMVSRELAVEEQAEIDEAEVAWDEINSRWQSELKDFLISIDPENAEEIYEAYLKEGKIFSELPPEVNMDEAQATHLENLKVLFGEHYQVIQDFHQEFINSVQDQSDLEVPLHFSL